MEVVGEILYIKLFIVKISILFKNFFSLIYLLINNQIANLAENIQLNSDHQEMLISPNKQYIAVLQTNGIFKIYVRILFSKNRILD